MATLALPRPDLDPNWDPEQHDLVFQVLDWYVPEDDRVPRIADYKKRYGMEYPEKPPEYSAMVFGVSAYGNSVCLKINEFCPSFYIQLPAKDWENVPRSEVDAKIREHHQELLNGKYTSVFGNRKSERPIIPWRLRSHLEYIKRVERKDFWGFNNGEKFPFIKLKVKSAALYNALKWYYMREKVPKGWKLYESNITPLLRLFHERKLDPCGWIRVKAGAFVIPEENDEIPMSRCQINALASVGDVVCEKRNSIAPLLIASFDIECGSSHGDFPVARKGYMKLAQDIVQMVRLEGWPSEETLMERLATAFQKTHDYGAYRIHRVYPKRAPTPARLRELLWDSGLVKTLAAYLRQKVKPLRTGENESNEEEEEIEDEIDEPSGTTAPKGVEERDVCRMLEGRSLETGERQANAVSLPSLEGDPLIQIGTTVHRYGSDEIIYRHITTLKSCDPIPGAVVESCETEEEVLMVWKDLMARLDPDILIGYNIFGFDMEYIWERALELDCIDEFSMGLGRIYTRRTWLDEQKLASSALGSNFLKFISMDGMILIDMYKVVQREQKLDSYKLDSVAEIFLGDHKNDLDPQEIFHKFRGSAEDRAVIARYCIQDCALVNRLFHKLKILENNVGMGNVCSVPLSYLFMRGQGIKIFSLVAKFCRSKGMVIPVVKGFNEESLDKDEVGYEGAIVLPPKIGMYLEDPITVFDFSSLYPSSMIERDLSHDRIVLNPEKYGNLQSKGVDYITVSYDEYADVKGTKVVSGKREVVFAKMPEKGVIPSILMELLKQRKNTRKKIEYETLSLKDGRKVSGLVSEEAGEYKVIDVEKGTTVAVPVSEIMARADTYNPFEMAVLEALQLAYKITANSLYGQIGSRTSPIYLKDIAACTTATGRERIMLAKGFMEKHYGAEVIYGDTDSIFCKFPCKDENGFIVKGREALPLAIRAGQIGAKAIKSELPPPQSLEYEKTLFPFIIFSKKRYVGNLYEHDANKKPKQKSMGIVMKRRDNAPIVKKIYGGILDCLMNRYSLSEAVVFLKNYLNDLVEGRVPLEDLIISKTLGDHYKDPSKIAHRVLADRMGERDPGNKPQINDRIPFVYIQTPPGVEVKLQGDKIEAPAYIRERGLTPDYRFYLTNQLIKPICQIFGLCVEQLEDYPYRTSEFDYWSAVEERLKEMATYAGEGEDREKKRADKMMALKIDMAKNILFDPFLERLPVPVVGGRSKAKGRPRAQSDALLEAAERAAKRMAKETAKPKKATASSLVLEFRAEEVAVGDGKTKTKVFEGIITVMADEKEIWKDTVRQPKGAKKGMVSKFPTFYSLLYEQAFQHLLKSEEWKETLMTHGATLRIHHNSSRLELVRAMKQLKECSFEEYQEKMMNEGMSGSLDELNQLRMYAYVAGFLNQIPHTILTESTKKDKEIE
jgi:DNA polymerase elongation subunit (family B)